MSPVPQPRSGVTLSRGHGGKCVLSRSHCRACVLGPASVSSGRGCLGLPWPRATRCAAPAGRYVCGRSRCGQGTRPLKAPGGGPSCLSSPPCGRAHGGVPAVLPPLSHGRLSLVCVFLQQHQPPGRSRMTSSPGLHLRGIFFQIRSHLQVLGFRIWTCLLGLFEAGVARFWHTQAGPAF